MAYKQSKHIFQGMNRDFSEDKQKNTFYIDAYNINNSWWIYTICPINFL